MQVIRASYHCRGALDVLLGLSSDGRTALVARAGSGLEIVDVESGAATASLPDSRKLAAGTLEDLVQAVLSPDGRRVPTAGENVRLWDAATGKQLALLGRTDESRALDFGDGGALALVASDTRTADFRAADGELVASDRSASDAISPDGAFVADAADEGSLAILDLRTGTRVALQTATARPLDSVSYGPTVTSSSRRTARETSTSSAARSAPVRTLSCSVPVRSSPVCRASRRCTRRCARPPDVSRLRAGAHDGLIGARHCRNSIDGRRHHARLPFRPPRPGRSRAGRA